MSYQVLARKWRPNSFAELVGQEHVVSAISNALDNDRLHHAYLFTGTRGVGKTTIARIFSKSLNCELGLSATPCGKCSTCVEIEQGNFIDMLEIDAASRTKVEDTRELLDNVQYRPSRGRYKVYLIDEVHMLSKHSFNALLKTLEEPPPHVKFLLATTDPQKLPVTILSRCLQFNLKALSRSQISQQLAFILQQEHLESESEALNQLARAAQGSMRDALSLTDQAIAQGNGVVSLSIVTDMLGLMDKNVVLKLLNALLQKHSDEVMASVDKMAMQAADFSQVLAELMSLLHQVALTQLVPDACKLETISARAIYQIAKGVAPEHIQLLYQIALLGKKDLPHAADARSGLEMTLLRMLAFCPDNISLNPEDINSLGTQALTSQPDVTLAPEKKVTVAQPSPETISLPEPEQPKAVDIHTQAKIYKNLEQGIQTHPEAHHAKVEVDHNDDYPHVDYGMDEEQQNLADSAYEQELFAQQQTIVEQAEYYGHSEQVATPDAAQSSPQSSLSTTETMIALRKKLQQSQAAMEEKSQAEKKPVKTDVPNLASIRLPKSNDSLTELKSITAAVEVNTEPRSTAVNLEISENPLNGVIVPVSVNHEVAPPWDDDDRPREREPEHTITTSEISSDVNTDSVVEAYQALDAHGHLGLDELGEVTIEIPLFLADQQKVISAIQVDEWSQLIDSMQITALTKQLALHSSFEKNADTVKLTLLASKEHLDTPSAREQIGNALKTALNADIVLEIELGHPINTPFAIQQKVNTLRQEYAEQVINNDASIRLMQELFAARVDNNSIVAK
ncbi:MAG: DNA polymerase III subunit gamma/tau [Paraglaciecola sp.]|nr:DNA polymerase III subunit gamma/tau [Paraglaciecola sp.]